ncbi:hypothetical protein CGLAMM_00815 [Acetobacteraceae bacterium EV16G]|uniref:Uncharacterized protein n=1 Tax=Sorlinia euscelidii TaxID=3081148 RepID=A0ABU7U2X9_9PROT
MPTGSIGMTDRISGKDFCFSEKESNFLGGILDTVGPMDGIRLNAFRIKFPHRAFRSLRRIGGAHDIAMMRDGIITLKHLHNDRGLKHGINQTAKERPRRMDGVESLSLSLCQLNALLRHDAQTCRLEDSIDFAGQVAARGIRLDDGQCPLFGHENLQINC